MIGLLTKDIEVLNIARYDYYKNWGLISHSHNNYYQIIAVFSGSCRISIKHHEFICEKNSIIFIPVDTIHSMEKIDNRVKTYDIKFQIFSVPLIKACREIPCITLCEDSILFDRLREMRRIGIKKQSYYQESCQLILSRVLLDLIPHRKENYKESIKAVIHEGDSEITLRVIDYLDRNYPSKITSEIIEKNIHYSYRYISNLFKKKMQVSPMNFLEALRIRKAQELILQTEKELKQIPDQVGFPDIHHFNQSFKKITGIPPGRWRDIEKEGIGKDIPINTDFKNQIYIDKNDDRKWN